MRLEQPKLLKVRKPSKRCRAIAWITATLRMFEVAGDTNKAWGFV
jgi:hypothetical protein